MSEPIPESIPTSADPRSRRPVKRARTGNNALAAQADEIENLMWDPSRPVNLPPSAAESKATLAAPPEIVANVQGSSAGAGSGEFHVYKASRRREYERLRVMDEEAKEEEERKTWEEKERERKEKDDEKTRKNREKRNKRKKGKGGKEEKLENGAKTNSSAKASGVKKNVNVPQKKDEEGEEDKANTGGSDFAIASIAKDNGLTIHDDD